MRSLKKLHFATQFLPKTNMIMEKIQPFEGVSSIKDYIGVFASDRHVLFSGRCKIWNPGAFSKSEVWQAGGGFKYGVFSPLLYLGKWSNLTNIFQVVETTN